ncbi:MAG: hypothetical protein JSR99_05065 [Proteobacteria bacterium]|nr:hypothetical protein [Pseudomonadota bacterium]
MGNKIAFITMVMAAGLAGTSALAESAEEPPMDLLASQARDQGFTCNHPKSARFDAKTSKPNEKVWVLQCEHDTFRMTVIPDLAAKIEKLDR